MNFFEQNKADLDAYAVMSQTAGARADYVQGGGGNTSVKLANGLMAIKASGYRLEQVAQESGYVTLEYGLLRKFFGETDPATLIDVEAEGAAEVKRSINRVEGMPELRPSVEAGFHSMLDKFVLHTHCVYANLACCSEDGVEVAEKALAGSGIGYCFVPYINPGSALTFAVDRAVKAEEQRSGKRPNAIFLQNHGLIVSDADSDNCTAIHQKINELIAAQYGVSFADFPAIELEQTGEGKYVSRCAYLKEKLATGVYDAKTMLEDVLYPDQLVFFKDSLEYLKPGDTQTVTCAIHEDGAVTYMGKESTVRAIEQTLCAVVFIRDTLTRTGHTVVPMSGSGKSFIGSWESEKHRKSLA